MESSIICLSYINHSILITINVSFSRLIQYCIAFVIGQNMHPQLVKVYTEHKEKGKKDTEKRKLDNNISTSTDKMTKYPKLIQTR